MTIKTKDRSWGGEIQSLIDDNPDSVGPEITTFKYTGSYQDSVEHGGSIPGWRSRIKSSLPCTTPLSGTFRSIRSTGNFNVNIRRRFKGVDPNLWRRLAKDGPICWQVFQLAQPSTLSLTSANNAALSGFVSKANSLISAFQGLTFLGEIRETIQMIRNPFRLLYKGVGSHIGRVGKIRRRRGESTRSLANRVSDLWLERAMGWSPLVNDIDTGMLALSRLGATRPPSQRVGFTYRDRKFNSGITYGPFQACFGQLSMHKRQFEEASVRYHGLVLLDWNEYSSNFSHFGVRLDLILPTAWELIPYSFLADYFANIGSIIEASSFAVSRLGWVEKGTQQLREELYSGEFSPPSDDNTYQYDVFSLVCNHEIKQQCKVVNRTDYSGLSLVPSLEFRIPGSSMRWLNILALGQQHRAASRRVFG